MATALSVRSSLLIAADSTGLRSRIAYHITLFRLVPTDDWPRVGICPWRATLKAASDKQYSVGQTGEWGLLDTIFQECELGKGKRMTYSPEGSKSLSEGKKDQSDHMVPQASQGNSE